MNYVKDWVPMFGADRRDVTEVKIGDLELVNIPFSQYGISENEELHFSADARFVKQEADPESGNNYPRYAITCLRNGNQSYFDPSFLTRRNIAGEYIYPEWASLGNAAEVAKALIKMGTIKGGKSFPVTMVKRSRGTRVQEAVRKPDGSLDLNDDGTPKMKDAGIERQYPKLPNPVK
jgi:hypothetical protein